MRETLGGRSVWIWYVMFEISFRRLRGDVEKTVEFSGERSVLFGADWLKNVKLETIPLTTANDQRTLQLAVSMLTNSTKLGKNALKSC